MSKGTASSKVSKREKDNRYACLLQRKLERKKKPERRRKKKTKPDTEHNQLNSVVGTPSLASQRLRHTLVSDRTDGRQQQARS